MKRSEKITLAALLVGGLGGLATWSYLPMLDWGWHAGFSFLLFCFVNAIWLGLAAMKRTVDR
jgi:hypothetical protein